MGQLDFELREIAYDIFSDSKGLQKDKYEEVTKLIEHELTSRGFSVYAYGNYVADLIATEWENVNYVSQSISGPSD